MKGILSNILMFAAGAAIGSAVAWKLTKTKYEQIAQEEIESVRALFETSAETDISEEDTEPVQYGNNKPDISELVAKIHDNEYAEVEEEATMDKPYVIPPEEFGEKDGYGMVSLTYYADKVVTIDNVEQNTEEPLEDVDGTIGLESLNHFGEYEDDSVFVRNDELRCDYEILMDHRNYADVANTEPHLAEGE